MVGGQAMFRGESRRGSKAVQAVAAVVVVVAVVWASAISVFGASLQPVAAQQSVDPYPRVLAGAGTDVCVLLDGTESAASESAPLFAHLRALGDLADRNAVNFGLARFVDHPIAPYGFPEDEAFALLESIGSFDDFRGALDGFMVGKGGDPAEAQLDAIVAAAGPGAGECGWRDGTARILLTYTDSRCHGVDAVHETSIDQAITSLREQHIVFVGIIDGPDAIECFEPLAAGTGGDVIGLGASVDDIVAAISEHLAPPATEVLGTQIERSLPSPVIPPIILPVAPAPSPAIIVAPTPVVAFSKSNDLEPKAVVASPASAKAPQLAITGSEVWNTAAVAIGLIACGGALVVASRRRAGDHDGPLRARGRQLAARSNRKPHSTVIILAACLVASTVVVASGSQRAAGQTPLGAETITDVAAYAPGGEVSSSVGADYFDKSAACRNGQWRVHDQELTPGLYFVDCDVVIDGGYGNVSIVSTGRITVGGEAIDLSGYDDTVLLLAGAAGPNALVIESDNSSFAGRLLAPNGDVLIAGDGNQVSCNGRPASCVEPQVFPGGLMMRAASGPAQVRVGEAVDISLRIEGVDAGTTATEIDWGDGTIGQVTLTSLRSGVIVGAADHHYTRPGEYAIEVVALNGDRGARETFAVVAEGPACTILGSAGDDTILGTDGPDVICGFGGDDEIVGGGGDDTVLGGLGSDTLEGGDGEDVVYGGAGHDEIDGGAGNDELSGDGGDDMLRGGEGSDVLRGGNGSDGADGGGGIDSCDAETESNCEQDPAPVTMVAEAAITSFSDGATVDLGEAGTGTGGFVVSGPVSTDVASVEVVIYGERYEADVDRSTDPPTFSFEVLGDESGVVPVTVEVIDDSGASSAERLTVDVIAPDETDVLIAPNVIVVDADLASQIATYDDVSGTVSLRGDQTSVLPPGHIMIVEPGLSPAAPDGVMRRIISSAFGAGQTTIETEEAQITDIFRQLTFEGTSGVNAPPANREREDDGKDPFGAGRLDPDRPDGDADAEGGAGESWVNAEAGVTLEMYLETEVAIDVDIRIGWSCRYYVACTPNLERFFAGAFAGVVAGAIVTATAEASWVREFPTRSFDLPPIRFSIGPVPVWFDNAINFTPGAMAMASGQATAQAEVSAGFTTGYEYIDGSSSTFFEPFFDGRFLWDASAEAQASAELEIELETLLYGTAGATFSVTPTIEGTLSGSISGDLDSIDCPTWDARLELLFPIEVGVTIENPITGDRIGEETIEIAEPTIVVYPRDESEFESGDQCEEPVPEIQDPLPYGTPGEKCRYYVDRAFERAQRLVAGTDPANADEAWGPFGSVEDVVGYASAFTDDGTHLCDAASIYMPGADLGAAGRLRGIAIDYYEPWVVQARVPDRSRSWLTQIPEWSDGPLDRVYPPEDGRRVDPEYVGGPLLARDVFVTAGEPNRYRDGCAVSPAEGTRRTPAGRNLFECDEFPNATMVQGGAPNTIRSPEPGHVLMTAAENGSEGRALNAFYGECGFLSLAVRDIEEVPDDELFLVVSIADLGLATRNICREPGGDEPGGDEPGGDEPGGDEPGGEPGGDEPGGEPGGDEPGGDEPGGEPGGDEPGGDEPGGGEPGGDEPGGEPGGDEPGDEPGGDEPGGDEPGGDEPVSECPPVPAPQTPAGPQTLYVSPERGLNLRDVPSAEPECSSRSDALAQGTSVRQTASYQGWAFVTVLEGPFEGRTGWMSANFLSTEPPGPSCSELGADGTAPSGDLTVRNGAAIYRAPFTPLTSECRAQFATGERFPSGATVRGSVISGSSFIRVTDVATGQRGWIELSDVEPAEDDCRPSTARVLGDDGSVLALRPIPTYEGPFEPLTDQCRAEFDTGETIEGEFEALRTQGPFTEVRDDRFFGLFPRRYWVETDDIIDNPV